MPPKKGKTGKKSKKGTKNNSIKKISLTPNEIVLTYRIQLKEEKLTNLKFELKKIYEDNVQINNKLKSFEQDKESFCNEMLRNYRESDGKASKSNVYKKSDVVNRMKSNWAISKNEQNEIIDLKIYIEDKDKKIKELESEISNLKYMKNCELEDNDQQIKILKHILDDMENNFNAIKSYLEKTYYDKKSELVDNEKLSTEKFQKDACIKASKVIKDNMKQEITDNKWLINKRSLHRENFERLKSEIGIIENENIQLNEKIFQLKQSEKKFANLFITEIEPDEILFNQGILEYDFNKVFKFYPKKNSELDENENSEIYSTSSFEKRIDLSYSSWKDYLNLNPVNFDFLYISGNLLDIQEAKPKTKEEMEEEMFTIKKFPVDIHSLKDNVII